MTGRASDVPVTLSGNGFQTATGSTSATTLAQRFYSYDTYCITEHATGTYELYRKCSGIMNVNSVSQLTVTVGSTTPTTDVPVRLTIPSGTNSRQTVSFSGTQSGTATLRVQRNKIQIRVAVQNVVLKSRSMMETQICHFLLPPGISTLQPRTLAAKPPIP